MSHPLASRAVKTIPFPPYQGHELTIQKLAGRHLYKADTENDFRAQEYMKRMGGAEFRKQLEEATRDDPKDETGKSTAVAKAARDPVHAYDKHIVVQYGLKAWTFTEDDGTPIPITPEAIEDLDPDALEFIAREILRWTRPSLFTEDAKAAQKETGGASPVS